MDKIDQLIPNNDTSGFISFLEEKNGDDLNNILTKLVRKKKEWIKLFYKNLTTDQKKILDINSLKIIISDQLDQGILYDDWIFNKSKEICLKYKKYNDYSLLNNYADKFGIEERLIANIKLENDIEIKKSYKLFYEKIFSNSFNSDWYISSSNIYKIIKSVDKYNAKLIKLELEVLDIIKMSMDTGLSINKQANIEKINYLLISCDEYESFAVTALIYLLLAQELKEYEKLKQIVLKKRSINKLLSKNSLVKILTQKDNSNKKTNLIFENEATRYIKPKNSLLTPNPMYELSRTFFDEDNTIYHQKIKTEFLVLFDQGEFEKLLAMIDKSMKNDKKSAKLLYPLKIETLLKNNQLIEALSEFEYFENKYVKNITSLGHLNFKYRVYSKTNCPDADEVKILLNKIKARS